MIKIFFKKLLLEAEGDSKELVKLNADRIRDSRKEELEAIKTGPDRSKIRDFEMSVKSDAEEGKPPSIFAKEIIEYFEKMPSEYLPEDGLKAFVKWLANDIIQTKQFPQRSDLKDVTNFFKETQNSTEIPDEWKFNFEMTFEEAFETAVEYEDQEIGKEYRYSIPVQFKFRNGWGISEISRDTGDEKEIRSDLNRESCDKFMNHCAGSLHVDDVLKGKEIIYSLRDPKNEPHVTMAYNTRTKEFVECKGRGNSKPKDEYLEMIVSWLEDNFEKEEWENLEFASDYVNSRILERTPELTEEGQKYLEKYQEDIFGVQLYYGSKLKDDETMPFFALIEKHWQKIVKYENDVYESPIINWEKIITRIGKAGEKKATEYIFNNWDDLSKKWEFDVINVSPKEYFVNLWASRDEESGGLQAAKDMIAADESKIKYFSELILSKKGQKELSQYVPVAKENFFKECLEKSKLDGNSFSEKQIQPIAMLFNNFTNMVIHQMSTEEYSSIQDKIFEISENLMKNYSKHDLGKTISIAMLSRLSKSTKDPEIIEKLLSYKKAGINRQLLDNYNISYDREKEIFLRISYEFLEIDDKGYPFLEKCRTLLQKRFPPYPELRQKTFNLIKEKLDFNLETMVKEYQTLSLSSQENAAEVISEMLITYMNSASSQSELEYLLEKLSLIKDPEKFWGKRNNERIISAIDYSKDKFIDYPKFEIGDKVELTGGDMFTHQKRADNINATIIGLPVPHGSKDIYRIQFDKEDALLKAKPTQWTHAKFLKKIEKIDENKYFKYNSDYKVFKLVL